MDGPDGLHGHSGRWRKWLHDLRPGLLAGGVVLLVVLLLRALVFMVFAIPSGSMEPTLAVGDRIVVNKMAKVDRGEVVVFYDELGWVGQAAERRGGLGQVAEQLGLLSDSHKQVLVKRVVGVPGDHVVGKPDGTLQVNGTVVDEQGYLYPRTDGSKAVSSGFPFDVVVPAGHVFVMGDNRAVSGDSRCHMHQQVGGTSAAFVSDSSVIGMAQASFVPMRYWHWLDAPAALAAVGHGEVVEAGSTKASGATC